MKIWRHRVPSYSGLGHFTYPAVGMMVLVVAMPLKFLVLSSAYKGALPLLFPVFVFSASLLLFFVYCIPFVAVRRISNPLFSFYFFSSSCCRCESNFYSKDTSSSTLSRVALCNVWDDQPFSVVRYVDKFCDRLSPRPFAAMRLV